MGAGTDVAIETGDIIIMSNNLNDVISTIQISKETMIKIKQNMFFALFYNSIGIVIAARVFALQGFILSPELAGFAMALSSVSVILSSLLLKRFKPNKKNIISNIAVVIMIFLFLFLFFEFTKIASVMNFDKENVSLQEKYYTKNHPSSVILKIEEVNSIKLFYVINKNNTPKEFVKYIDSNLLNKEFLNNRTYFPLYIGFSEAKMMKNKNIFKNEGDVINDLFGNNFIVKKVLPKTNSVLDNMHFIGNDVVLIK